MKIRKKSFFLGVLLVVLGSCAPIYFPPAAHVPQLTVAGESQAGIMFGFNGLDLQGAYALTDHQAMMGTVSLGLGNNSSSDKTNHAYGEVAYGLYTAPGIGRFGVYGGLGAGYGQGESTWYFNGNPITSWAKGTYIRPFIQGNAGLSTGVFDLGLNLRMPWVLITYSESKNNSVPSNANALMMEPVLYTGVGWGPVKVYLQGGLAFPLQNQINFEYQPFIFSLGLNMHFYK